MRPKKYLLAFALLSLLFVLLFGACSDPSEGYIYWCDETNNCADVPTTVCSEHNTCLCPKENYIFCYRFNACVPLDVCSPPPPCTPLDAGDAGTPDGD